jgi:prevent-host-death family protein
MRRVTVTELKNSLSKYLRLVKQGETVEVLERSVPIARIHAVVEGRGESHLHRLVRDGIVSEAKGPLVKDVLSKPPIRCKVDPVKILIDERRKR